MATFTISVYCASDVYPNDICLVYGEGDFQVLCAAWDPTACDV